MRFDKKVDKREKGYFKSVFGKYFLWGTVQQVLVVLVFIALDKWTAIDRPWLIVCVAGAFGFAHFPNFLLMFSTLAMGQLFIIHY